MIPLHKHDTLNQTYDPQEGNEVKLILAFSNHTIEQTPSAVPTYIENESVLKIRENPVMEAGMRTQGKKGYRFLEDHLLLFVLEGMFTVRYGSNEFIAHKNEMILIPKAIMIQWEKSGHPARDYLFQYITFFLRDDLLREFSYMHTPTAYSSIPSPPSVHVVNERLSGYLASLKTYFNKPDQIREGLLRVKLLELLYDVADANHDHLWPYPIQDHPERKEIVDVVEANIANSVSLHELASLSGRSLSSFKRDFQATYNSSPSKWIRNKRLDMAQMLLSSSALSVTDVCYSTGFENVTHFSKVFKNRFGFSPSAFKKQR
ncbi:helix-turn-helix domain-containing protein [Cohnella sp. GCM10027633]|uniref:helix-turn-helix domain-containing protein n=1 Tax=unclassified Cohnella TaxID=2636738 RepID=UPI003642E59E